MRLMKLVTLGIMLGAGITFFTGCSDDESNSTVLLRPVTTMESDKNTVKLKWQNVEDATEYVIEVYRAVDSDYELYKTYTTDQTSYTIVGLDWDEKYKVKVKSTGSNRESAYWETSVIAVSYPTKLGETKAIDNAARITWQQGGNTITALKAIPADGAEVLKTITSEEYAAGAIIMEGLSPETTYKICAYSGTEQTVDTYEGRVAVTTQVAEDYDAQYGAGKWKDYRANKDPQIFNSEEFWTSLEEGTTIILSGGTSYQWGERSKLDKSVSFVTALTLEDNAKFYMLNAFVLATDVESLSFKGIDFYGVIDADYTVRPIEDETAKGFSGKQILNENGTNTTLGTLSFTDCSFTSFRALVRLQAANDGVRNIIFKGCTLNGMGDQGVVSTNNKAGTMDNITFDNCVIMNTVMLADLRTAANIPTFNITDCTFCYAPLDGTANQLIRVSKYVININIKNTIFGPPVMTNGSGLTTYTAGTQASRMSDLKTFAPNVTNCWISNFTMDTGCPFVNCASTGINEKTMFQNPEKGDFKVIGQFDGATSAGVIKWRK